MINEILRFFFISLLWYEMTLVNRHSRRLFQPANLGRLHLRALGHGATRQRVCLFQRLVYREGETKVTEALQYFTGEPLPCHN